MSDWPAPDDAVVGPPAIELVPADQEPRHDWFVVYCVCGARFSVDPERTEQARRELVESGHGLAGHRCEAVTGAPSMPVNVQLRRGGPEGTTTMPVECLYVGLKGGRHTWRPILTRALRGAIMIELTLYGAFYFTVEQLPGDAALELGIEDVRGS